MIETNCICLQVTKNDEKVMQKETELKEITERLVHHEQEVQNLNKQYEQALEEKNILAEQLQAETELCAEAEEMRARLAARKQEIEEITGSVTINFNGPIQNLGSVGGDGNSSQIGNNCHGLGKNNI